MLKHYVSVFYPGLIVSDESSQEINSRDEFVAPKNALGFRFFDKEEYVINGTLCKSDKINISPMYYQGRAYTLEQAMYKFGASSILVSNMKCNRWNRIVEHSSGFCTNVDDNYIILGG